MFDHNGGIFNFTMLTNLDQRIVQLHLIILNKASNRGYTLKYY